MNNPFIRSERDLELFEAWKEGFDVGKFEAYKYSRLEINLAKSEMEKWKKNAAYWQRRLADLEKKFKDQIDQAPLQS